MYSRDVDELPVIAADIVHLDKNTFMWVQLTHFGEAPKGDMSAIAALIASPGTRTTMTPLSTSSSNRSNLTVFDLLPVGKVYTLSNPGDDAMHDYGAVTGGLGFHEFVVIDRANGTVHVVVASDD